MNINEFLQVLKNPGSISNLQTFELEDILNEYPFFQPARAIYLKGLKDQNSFRYNQNLKLTAAYTSHRNVLFRFIASSEFDNVQLKEEETQTISQIKEVDDRVEEQLNITPDISQEIVEISKKETIEKDTLNSLYAENEISAPTENIDTIDSISTHLVHSPEKDDNEENLTNEYLSNDIVDEFQKEIESKEAFEDFEESEGDVSENIQDLEEKNTDEQIMENSPFLHYDESLEIVEEPVEEVKENNEEVKITREQEQTDTFIDPLSDYTGLDEVETSDVPTEMEALKESESIENDYFEKEADSEIAFELFPNEIIEEPLSFEPLAKTETYLEGIEEVIDIPDNSPVRFSKNEIHTFNEWLQLSTFKPIDRSTTQDESIHKEKKMELIDEFIVKNPKMPRAKTTKKDSTEKAHKADNEDIMTETLARVFVLQEKYDDAIRAYEILSLKFPEKSSYFATQIKQINILKKNH